MDKQQLGYQHTSRKNERQSSKKVNNKILGLKRFQSKQKDKHTLLGGKTEKREETVEELKNDMGTG